MKKHVRFISLLLAVVLLLGAVPAYAAEVTGLNGNSGKWADFDESVYDEVVSVSDIINAKVNGYTWPSSGTILLKVSSSTYTLTGSRPNCIGITIPGGLVVDIYKYYQSAGMTEPVYQLLGHFDTRNGNSYTIGSSNPSVSAATVSGFNDVRSTEYYADAVKWAKEAGVTTGTSATTFSPNNTVTRAQAVTFLWRAADSPEPSSKASPFSDVTDPGAYYYKAVLWAAEKGITNGVSATTFGLNGTLAYDQMLAFLCRAAGEDASGSDWSANAVAWAKQNGLTEGLTITAKGNCPRSDVVYFLWKQLEEQQVVETPMGLSDAEGAKAAIINGFLERSTQIAVSSYNVESSALMELAEEIADKDGSNPYHISTLACGQEEGRRALFLQVFYLMQGSSSAYETSEEIRSLAEDVVKEIVTPGMSDYDTAKALHDWLVLNCKYDMRLYSGGMPNDSYTAYGPLKYGTSVCAGYAKAYLALLEAAGMDAEYVTGNTTRGYHAWNIVKIDGQWYHVDTTWDDPTPDKEGYIRYNYFLKSDSYMSKDHSNWSTKQTCTSTKYDNADLPDTAEQAKQQEKEKEQARLAPLADEITAYYLDALGNLPYATEAELQAAEELDYNDRYVTISLPDGRYDSSDLSKTRDMVKERLEKELSSNYPNLELDLVYSSYVRIKRLDVEAELKRRSAVRQEETNAHVAEIEEILKETIRNGDVRIGQWKAPISSDYDYTEVRKAISNITAKGYSFDGYTAGVDYSINSYSSTYITVNNLRKSVWAEGVIQEYLEMVNKAVLNRDEEVLLPLGDYPDDQPSYYANRAADRVEKEGFSFDDGLTSGVDFTITGTYSNANKGVTVRISYPEQWGLTTEAEFIAQIQDAIRRGKTTTYFQIETSEGRSAFYAAIETMSQDGYSFDGYTCGNEYRIRAYTSGTSRNGVYSLQIAYPSAE